MAFGFTFSKRFRKSFGKFEQKDKERILKKLDMLSVDPYHPSLRTKHYKSREGSFEASVNMDIRIIWYYEDDNTIYLSDVGHHDILKRY
ncbi:MAG: cytotoxin [Defluviitaleaceae bacterium]|nr:cytotoxin [Defluviitaleaceae bacterium]